MTVNALRCAAPAAILAVAVLLPFHDKAFAADDTLFLRQAEHVLTDPLHPTAFEVVWSEHPVPVRMSLMMPSGPVMAYLLAPAVALESAESIAHLTQLLLMLAALFATVDLALRWGLAPSAARWAALLLVATPSALAMAGTAMPDVSAMAFGVLGMARLAAWRQEGRWHQAVLAAVALALAALSRPHLVLLLGLAPLALVGDFLDRGAWRRSPGRIWLPLPAAPALFIAALVLTRDSMASSAALGGAASTFSSLLNVGFSSLLNVGKNVVAYSVHWVIVIPLALPWLLLHPASVAKQPFLYLGAVVAALVLSTVTMGYDATSQMATWTLTATRILRLEGEIFLIAPLAGLGAGVLANILADGWRRRDTIQILLGLWLLIPLPVALYIHLPSKYLLAAAPAAAILVARALAAREARRSMAVLGVTLALGLVLGVLILRADSVFAGLGRQAATELIAPEVAAGRNVWFAGHWGFQWYAEKAGARPLTITPPHPVRGDLALSSLQSLGDIMGPRMRRFPRRKLLRTLMDDTPGGRVMAASLGAGFYSNAWGYLPWAWGDEPIDRFDLWEMK